MTATARGLTVPVLAFALVTAGMLAVNGLVFPMELAPDSYGYLAIAEDLARIWRDGGSIFDSPEQFRVLGYPVLIALLELTLGPQPFAAMLVLQSAMVVGVGTVLFWSLLRVGIGTGTAAVLAFLYISALPAMFATYLLTDTLSNCLTAVAICVLAVPLFDRKAPALVPASIAGLAFGSALFVRDANQYLVLCMLPVVLAIALGRMTTLRALGLVLVFLAPALLAAEAYKAFNTARFAERFVSTGARIGMIQSTLPVARQHPSLFGSDSKLDAAARAKFEAYDLTELLALNAELLGEGYGEARLARDAFAKFFEAWRRYPAAMAFVVAKRVRIDKQATNLFNPFLAFETNARWRDEYAAMRSSTPTRASGEDAPWTRTKEVLSDVGAVPSVLIYALGLLGGAVAALDAWRKGARSLAVGLAAMITAYAGYVLVYGLVHVEMRYLAGAASALVLTAANSLAWWRQRSAWRPDNAATARR